MNIKNLLAFCMTQAGDLGIADINGTFASTAWGISDEAFKKVSGNKFGWTAPDGKNYTEDKSIFIRPTEEQIKTKITPALQLKAVEMDLIEL